MNELRKAIRAAIVTKLTGDTALQAFFPTTAPTPDMLVRQFVTYTARAPGAGSGLTITIVDDGTGIVGIDTLGADITIHVDAFSNTAQDVVDAVNAGSALVSASVTAAHAADPAAADPVHALAGGSDAVNQVAMSYRPTRQKLRLPTITMFDSGTKGDDTVPLYDRDYQVDCWAADLDVAEDIAQRVTDLLDHQPLGLDDGTFALPGGEGQVAFLSLASDRDFPLEDGDVARKCLMFRMLAYNYG